MGGRISPGPHTQRAAAARIIGRRGGNVNLPTRGLVAEQGIFERNYLKTRFCQPNDDLTCANQKPRGQSAKFCEQTTSIVASSSTIYVSLLTSDASTTGFQRSTQSIVDKGVTCRRGQLMHTSA